MEKVYFTIKLAGHAIGIEALFQSTKEFCRDYLIAEPAEWTVTVTPEDITYEHRKSAEEDAYEGIAVRHFSDAYLETLAVYRKIAELMIEDNILLFHGSVVAVDGEAYLFTAKSGTGKSTHTSLWRKYFGERAVMVNDDKPLIRIAEDGVIAYGTPWDGKHHLSNNIAVPLKAVCYLKRDVNNHVEPLPAKEAWPILRQQSYRPTGVEKMVKTLKMLDLMIHKVGLYTLGCNMDIEAAKVSYEGMQTL